MDIGCIRRHGPQPRLTLYCSSFMAFPTISIVTTPFFPPSLVVAFSKVYPSHSPQTIGHFSKHPARTSRFCVLVRWNFEDKEKDARSIGRSCGIPYNFCCLRIRLSMKSRLRWRLRLPRIWRIQLSARPLHQESRCPLSLSCSENFDCVS